VKLSSDFEYQLMNDKVQEILRLQLVPKDVELLRLIPSHVIIAIDT
jgi:hypothetical protein